MRLIRLAALAAALLLAACGGDEQAANTVYPVETRPLTPEGAVIPERASVTLQLPAAAQARFAGYYAADAKGFFEDVKLDVTIKPGGTPEEVVAGRRAEFGIGRLPALLAARDRGTDLVNVAQVFHRGPTLGDGVFVRGDWIAEPVNRDITIRFLQASFLGWTFCREYAEECLEIVLEAAPGLDEARQRFALNEINALIWPNETGIGTMDPAAFRRTAEIAHESGVIERPATQDAWRDDLALYAVTEGEDEDELDTERHWDLRGQYWEKPTVEVTAD